MPTAAAKPGSLAEAVVALQGELPHVTKGSRAEIKDNQGNTTRVYTYVSLGDLYEALIPVMQKHGLSFTCVPERVPDMNAVMAVGVLRHGPSGESDRGYWPIRGENAQALGSSLTYARRYLACAMTGVVADEDDDGAAEKRAPGHSGSDAPPPPPPPENPDLFPPLTADPSEQAATDTLLTDLRQFAYEQEPKKDLAWITAKWRTERGNFPVDRLREVHPDALEPLYQQWVEHRRTQGVTP